MKRANSEQDFWDRVAIDGDNNCWEWYACLDVSGYGRFKMNGKEDKAHRWAYRFVKGEISPFLIVRHICDNRTCVNPAHLELGTHKDNAQDRSERTFHFKGETNPNAVLSNTERDEIRSKYVPRKVSQRALAKEYGVTRAAVWYVLKEKTYA